MFAIRLPRSVPTRAAGLVFVWDKEGGSISERGSCVCCTFRIEAYVVNIVIKAKNLWKCKVFSVCVLAAFLKTGVRR